ncbi:hypothetical protein BDY21DRAFT_364941 [Lineolata rhizophorae]|uniref:Uncharacterized protein n=1 Tax=Lineolata rhizophorae TaxID=578093 RepID=A0A6A6NWQ5_9PEZI|nr:hypothetical protein BDY21DRAFT_364941 [Lineolata rhizophorae]
MTDPLHTLYASTLPPALASSPTLSAQLAALLNGDYHALLSSPFARQLLGLSADTDTSTDSDNVKTTAPSPSAWLASLRTRARARAASTTTPTDPHSALLVALAAHATFLQSNLTGPVLPFRPGPLLLPPRVAQDARRLAAFRRGLVRELCADGVSAYALTPDVEAFCAAEAVLGSVCEGLPAPEGGTEAEAGDEGRGGFETAARWARLRALFTHQKLLAEAAPGLQRDIYAALDGLDPRVLEPGSGVETDGRVAYLLERAAIHTFHGLDARAREDVDAAAKLRRFEFVLTGLLGKRTRFQEKETSQLVVLARSYEKEEGDDEVDGGGNEAERAANGDEKGKDERAETARPGTFDLNDDTLLESISFTSQNAGGASSSDLPGASSSTIPPALASLDPAAQPRLHPLDAAILLAHASAITNTNPTHGLTREQTAPFATRVIEGGSANWQVYTQALLVRSRVEGYSARTAERGLLQLQALVDQVVTDTASAASTEPTDANTTSEADATKAEASPLAITTINADASSPDSSSTAAAATTFLPRPKSATESAPAQARLAYAPALASPLRWTLEAELAARWVALGGLRSALAIYARLRLWGECALCWAATGREDRARRVVRRLLFVPGGPEEAKSRANTAEEGDVDVGADFNVDGDVDAEAEAEAEPLADGPERDPLPPDAPRLFCILGDLDRAPAMYERAWAVSGGRYARAQRSLGRLRFAERDFAAAAAAYAKSLAVNQTNGAAWFALGCALLEMGAWGRAAEAFGRCVQLDDGDAEAWSNLGTALLRMGMEDEGAGGDDDDGDEKERAEAASGAPAVRLADGSDEGQGGENEDVAEDNTTTMKKKKTPAALRADALRALLRAAHLKHDDARIWDNVLTVAASTTPPSYAAVVRAQTRLIELRGGASSSAAAGRVNGGSGGAAMAAGEAVVDADILDRLVRHVITETAEPDSGGGRAAVARPGLPRLVDELVERGVAPVVTGSRRLWRAVARLRVWKGEPAAALAAEEKGWRAAVYGAGGAKWEAGLAGEGAWDEVVEATVELAEAYESLGGRTREGGEAEGEGAAGPLLVAPDWRFKARSAVRGVMGRGKECWEGSAGWERLRECLDGLKGGR